MIIQQTIMLQTPMGPIEATLRREVGHNHKDQHRAIGYVNAMAKKLEAHLNENPSSWQPDVSSS